MTHDQRAAYEKIMHTVDGGKGGNLFIDTP